MNCQPQLFLLLVVANLHCLLAAVDTNEIDSIVKYINSINTTWKAGYNPPDVLEEIEESLKLARKSNSSWNKSRLPTKRFNRKLFTPKSFDAREKWPDCKNVIGTVRKQGKCGSCWAVQTAAMLSDRICIGSRGSTQISLSAQDLIECCKCGGNEIKSCKGGDADKAMKYWMEQGIVTGGNYQSREGCKPYSKDAIRGVSKKMKCVKKCTNRGYTKSYANDKHFGRYNYNIIGGEKHMQQELMRYGPVAAYMMVFKDLRSYKQGVYVQGKGKYEGPHIVKIIGWGEEKGVKYWLCMNSWGNRWGELEGYFKILRGTNHCKIESVIRAGRPKRGTLARDVRMGKSNRGNSFKPSSTKCLALIFILLIVTSPN